MCKLNALYAAREYYKNGTEQNMTVPVLELEATQNQHTCAGITLVESLTPTWQTEGLCLPVFYAGRIQQAGVRGLDLRALDHGRGKGLLVGGGRSPTTSTLALARMVPCALEASHWYTAVWLG